jgi:hypothetical protein
MNKKFLKNRLGALLVAGTTLVSAAIALPTSSFANPATETSTTGETVKKVKKKAQKRTKQNNQTAASKEPLVVAAAPAPALAPIASDKPKEPDEISGQGLSTAKTPKEDKKDSKAPEYANNRARQSLGAVESQRKDELSGKALWENKENFRLKDIFGVPEWISLSLEERVRYENYSTPWRGGKVGTTGSNAKAGSQSTVGQESLDLQTVLWNEFRFTNQFRAGYEFWDARQWSGPGQQDHKGNGATVQQNYPDNVNSSMVNTGQFAQIYAAYIERGVFEHVDSETKAGQMTMNVGSNRLIGRAAFRNTQQQFVGVQQRFREDKGNWELMAFANVPEILQPGTPTPNNPSGTNATINANTNNVIWNRPETNAYFTGAIFNGKFADAHFAEGYLMYLNEGPQNILNRRLFTPGFRVYSPTRKGEIDYEFETIGQTGTSVLKAPSEMGTYKSYNPGNVYGSQSGYLKSQQVGSVFQHIHVGYAFNTDFDPRLTAQWDYGTSHFDTLYGPTVFEYGPTGIAGFFGTRTNFNSPGWKLQFIPHRDVTVYLNQRWWWMADAYSTSGWSSGSVYNATTGKNYQGSYIGETIELNARWDAHQNVAFQAGWQVLMKGDLASKGTGAVGINNNQDGSTCTTGCSANAPNTSNVNYFYVQAQLRL